MTAQGLTNLTAFARLYGYVRFFHPSDQAALTDWETFAIDGVRAVEDAASLNDLQLRLENLSSRSRPPSGSSPPPAAPSRRASESRRDHPLPHTTASAFPLPPFRTTSTRVNASRARPAPPRCREPFAADWSPD